MSAGLLYFCSQHFFICSGSNGFSISVISFCTLLSVQIESCSQCLSMLLDLSELAHYLPYRLYDSFLHCAILLCLPNCFHLAFPQTGTKHYFQGLKLENEG